MTAIPRLRSYGGPALLSYGFRPFFFFGAVYAALAVAIWLPFLHGILVVPTAFSPRDWHVHEMLYGYVPAIVTGFLLTAIPNWTGQLPLQGRPLGGLVIVWALGRLAVALSDPLGWRAAAMADASYLFLLAGLTAREIIGGRNWRNLKVLGPVLILGLGNAAFHIEAQRGGADYSIRIGVAAVLALLMLVGGRVVPSFTHNALKRGGHARMPASFGAFDVASMLISIAALAVWTVAPFGRATSAALITAGVLQGARLARWKGASAFRDRLVFVLHAAYTFVPLGFLLAGCAAIDLLPVTAGLHAWMVGAVGLMTLAVMTRASLGHTGRQLRASAATQALYVMVIFAAFARLGAALEIRWGAVLLWAAALAWSAGFAGFAVVYGPMLWRGSQPRA